MSARRVDIGIKSARLQSVARSGALSTTAAILRLLLRMPAIKAGMMNAVASIVICFLLEASLEK